MEKVGCTRQYESELSLRSFAQPFPSGYRGCTNRPTRCYFFSKTYPFFLTLKEGSTAFPKPFSPQGTRDVPTALLGAQTASLYGWRTIRGLRQQRSCGFLCGDGPAFTQGFDKGLLARCFFRKPTSPPLPLREGPPLISVFSPQGRRGNRSSSSLVTISFYGWRTIRGLRQQQSCVFLCGDEPALLSLLLARC